MEETKIPQPDYWMLNTAIEALNEAYNKEFVNGGYNQKVATEYANKNGLEAYKRELQKEHDNKYTKLGQIWQTRRRLEEMREAITKHVEEQSK